MYIFMEIQVSGSLLLQVLTVCIYSA